MKTKKATRQAARTLAATFPDLVKMMRQDQRDAMDAFRADPETQEHEGNAAYTYQDPYNVQIVTSAYLGTIFGLTPSGKYYTPWAHSNVTPCPKCQGAGSRPNPRADAEAHANATRARARWIRRMLDAGQNYQTASPEMRDALDRLRATLEKTQPEKTCPFCDGLGSREALLDQVWWEEAETRAEKLDATIHLGEDCPTDIYLTIWADWAEPEEPA